MVSPLYYRSNGVANSVAVLPALSASTIYKCLPMNNASRIDQRPTPLSFNRSIIASERGAHNPPSAPPPHPCDPLESALSPPPHPAPLLNPPSAPLRTPLYAADE
eukprot:1191059-Prorocentrum_minimum.AAC.4